MMMTNTNSTSSPFLLCAPLCPLWLIYSMINSNRGGLLLLAVFAAALSCPAVADEPDDSPGIVELSIEQLPAIAGREDADWTQARTAHVPGDAPLWLTTASLTGKTGTHAYHDIFQMLSRDGGKTWSDPAVIPTLRRVKTSDGYEVAPGDLWPAFHEQTGKVLTTGKTFNFEAGRREEKLRERVSYAVFDPQSGEWGPLRFLDLPKTDHSGAMVVAANAGCNQRVDLANGDVLLPVRYWRSEEGKNYVSTVVRCKFDGETLTYLQHGTEHTIERGRGLYEPSLGEHAGRFFLTLRADHSAYVAASSDGLHFSPIREWAFDDGAVLGSYNTQQHWATIGGGLFLIYTRRGADNDHIFRHRAPLFIAQVDPEELHVIRATERILLPENRATLGNSGVCRISPTDALITCGEGRVSYGERKGEKNRVLFVKVSVREEEE